VRRFIPYAPTFLIALCALFIGCSSEDAVTPPGDGTCSEQNPGGFAPIQNPEAGRVYVWAGTGLAGAGEMGRAPGQTRLYWPIEVNFDPAGDPIVLDWNNHRVIALDANGNFEKLIGRYFGNPLDGPALDADLNHPTHVTFSPDGTKLVLSAWHNSIVMELDLASDWIARYCGTGGRCFNTSRPRLSSCLDLPVCALFGPDGNLYIGDQANHVIKKIDFSSADTVRVVAGSEPISNGVGGWTYQFGYAGDGGPATSALFHFERGQQANPSGRFCFDGAGNMYIADTDNHAIRIVYPNGNIDTFAGMGPGAGAGHSGDGGLATLARLNEPRDVVAGPDGSIYIADTGNHVVRKVAPDGTISTIVGVVRPWNADPISPCTLKSEQGAPARDVHLTAPYGIELDADGNLWIADTQNNAIRILFQ